MNITFCGHDFIIHPSGALYWPAEEMVVVSDLHLEKGSFYALRGFFLPPYDTHATLSALQKVCHETGCKKLLLLGDSFHDPRGYERLMPADKTLLNELLQLDPIWIQGNHDQGFAPPGFIQKDEWERQGIMFRHIATRDGQQEISGHYHPKIQVTKSFSAPCFVQDSQHIIMSAFGAYTGGLFVNDRAIQALVNRPVFHALHNGKVVSLKKELSL